MIEPKLEPYAVKLHCRFENPLPGNELRRFFVDIMEGLGRRCMATGAALIGHIKGFAATSGDRTEKHFLKISVIDPERPAQVDGRLPDGCRDVTLTLNVHVYGLSSEYINHLVYEMTNNPELQKPGGVTLETNNVGNQ